jgi:flagellar basal body-associated protein FliL
MLKKPKILIPVVALVVLLLVGVAYMMFLKPAPAAPNEEELAKTPGPIHEMVEPFVVNLDGGESHFAKIGVALHVSELSAGEVAGGGGHGAGEEATPIHDEPIIRDIIIAEAQKASVNELATEKGRAALKKHIKHRVNEETHTHITDVYWTEFAVQ